MADRQLEYDSIGPQVDLAGLDLPTEVGEGLATVYGVDGPIETGREWIEAARTAVTSARGREPTVEDLCTDPDGRHTFEGERSQSYVCVLDPIIYAFVTNTPGTVRSETPVRETVVEIGIEPDEATVSHEDAVVSLGVASDLEEIEETTPELAYREVCEYVHVFADRDEYDRWAASVEAATFARPAREGVAVAGGLAKTLFE